MLEKEKEVWTNIIEIYKDMPFLWDKTNNNYLNRDMRQEGLQILLQQYKEFDENATIIIFKKKLENMRTTYNRELKKIKASKITGSGLTDVYVPVLWYFDLLGFLDENNKPCREGTDTLEDSHEDSQPSTPQSSSQDQEPSTSTQQSVKNQTISSETPKQPPNKKQRRSLQRKQEELLDRANNLMAMKEEEWEVIGKSIGVQLKDLNKQTLFSTQKWDSCVQSLSFPQKPHPDILILHFHLDLKSTLLPR